jgi:putative nucleotidyltransferase with HDIG domain
MTEFSAEPVHDLSPELAELLKEAKAAEQTARRGVARDHYEALLSRLRDPAHAPLAAAVMRWIGRTYSDDADMEAAIDCLTAALAVSEAIGDRSGAAHTINVMAIAHLQRGLIDDAERLYIDALERARLAGAERLCAMIEQNLGILAMIRGDLDGARQHYEVSLSGYRRLGLEHYSSLVLNNLGMLYTDSKRWDDAERAYRSALESCEAAGGDIHTRVMIEVNRAGFWIARRELDRARESCVVAHRLAERVGDERALAEIHKHYGVIARERGEYRHAEDRLAFARQIAEGRQDLLLAAETAREQAELYAMQRRNRETLQHLNSAHKLFTQLRAQRALADVDRRMGRLETTFVEIVREWSHSIESADLYTRGHCDRVAEYACTLAAASGFDEKTLFWFRMGALLHDVGKIVVPVGILNKPGKLTPEERVIMESHAAAGAELLDNTDFPWDIRPMVRNHHEQWGGGGYPDRLAGEAIPLSARILCVADVYDALTTDRPYRAAYSHRRALQEMAAMTDVFDPELFRRFAEISNRTAGWPIRSAPPTLHIPAATRRSSYTVAGA